MTHAERADLAWCSAATAIAVAVASVGIGALLAWLFPTWPRR